MPVRVYLPLVGAPLDILVMPGSAVVSAAEPEEERLLVDYEGSTRAENIITFADRCHHAADRHRSFYPTVARAFVPVAQLIPVGSYDPEMGEITLDGDEERVRLAAWLGLDDDALDRELSTEGSLRHKMRREVQALKARGDLVRARWLARHYHLDDVV